MTLNKNILITGPPGVGKTTLIEKLLSQLKLNAVGFITREIRKQGRRVGFNIESLSGFKTVLASKFGPRTPYRVGSYFVQLSNLENLIFTIRDSLKGDVDLIVIDEIGKMELFSKVFRDFVEYALSTRKLLGTIMLRDNEYTRKIKTRDDVKLVHISYDNRNSKLREILHLISSTL